MSGLDKYKILSAIEITVNANKNRSEKFEILDYKNKHVSDQVSKIIFSYIEFINKNVWKKNNSINRL
jgi:UDP-N-acetylglucosamine 2-epimerase (non-hydrolysing)